MLFSKILDKLQLTLNPVKYGRKQGAIIGDNCKILCGGSFSFGSEPYLIELGNHVEITSGCRLITHDGGMWSLPSLMGGYLQKIKYISMGELS